KKIILAIATLLVLLLVGGGGFVFMSKKVVAPQNGQITPMEKTTKGEDTNSISGTIYDLLNLGKSLKCTYDYNLDENKTSGTTYISGKKMRGDFEIVMGETKIKNYMISDGDYFYSWADNSKTGTKMKINATENPQQEQATENQNVNIKTAQEKYDYKCENWIVDETMFQLPNGITFTDFSTVLENMKSGKPSLDCSSCELIPESDTELRAKCKTSLKCE
nr:hypothetical protein [Patescibacteria group bacterium]